MEGLLQVVLPQALVGPPRPRLPPTLRPLEVVTMAETLLPRPLPPTVAASVGALLPLPPLLLVTVGETTTLITPDLATDV